ncbi:MAG: hypothetical protein EON93_25905 [Burkholderiales bacterium]|nr:MAG: hypothetical protein EON93_25905 [Burkholderiales bacterium]
MPFSLRIIGTWGHLRLSAWGRLSILAPSLSTRASLGDFPHVAVNAAVGGRSRLGRRVLLGAGAVVINGVSVCDDVLIGAGSTVVADILKPGTYVGSPARRIR